MLGSLMKNEQLKSVILHFLNDSIPIYIKENIFNANLYKINNIISTLMNDSQIENNKTPFEDIFKILMSEQSIAIDYFTVLLEIISHSQTLDPKSILCSLNKDYSNNKNIFVYAICRCYDFHTLSRIFVRKDNCQSISLPLSKTGTAVISILLDKISQTKSNYQAFYCLLNISSSFPFLFTQNCHQIFNSVLQAFEHFSLFYTIKDNEITEEYSNNIKSSLTALIFLISTLYSVITINSFVPWLFENILFFSDSQVLAFIFVLISLFKEKKINKIMLALSIKHNFIKTIYQLLSREVTDILKNTYKCYIFQFLLIYYDILNKLSNKQIIYVNELSKIDDPFILAFHNLSIIDVKILKLTIDLPQNSNKFEEYLKKLSEIKYFYVNKIFLNHENEDSISDFGVELFLLHYIKLNKFSIKYPTIMEDTIIDFDDKVKKYEYLATKPRWVYKWIIKGHKFPLLNHHKSILLQTIDDLKEINKVKMDFKDEVNIKDINTNDYFINEFNQRKLFDCLINDAKTSDQNLFNNIASLITTITKNNYAMNLFIEIIHLNIKEDNESKESIHSLVNLLLQISNNENFKDYFKQNYYNNLIDIGLSYEFRTDSEFLSKISKLYCKSNHHYSSRITHLVGFMFLLNQQNIIPDALALCSNIEYQKLDNVIHIIEKYLDNELNNINPSYLILKSFLEQIPFLAKQKILKLINRMNALFRKYIKSNDENLINLLCLIFNFITPNRNENDSLVNGIDFSPQTWKTSIENIQKHKKKRKIKINEVPDDYVQKYPDFFKQFRKNVKIVVNVRLWSFSVTVKRPLA